MNKTDIEYLDYTWNPLVMRCTPVSEGCRSCWHLSFAKRLAKNPLISKQARTAYAGGIPHLNPKELEAPLHLKGSSRIGVQFMGDLFHEDVPMEKIGRILCLARATIQHKFLFLTKRPKRMREALWAWDMNGDVIDQKVDHLFFGVSVENQQTADERIPILLRIPAAKRFVSVEPMLGPIDLTGYSAIVKDERRSAGTNLQRLDWVIVGQETGPHARPANIEWFNNVITQCRTANIPVFIKKAPEGVEIIREFPRG